MDRLTPRTVNTWDLLKKAFIQRYCPPSKTAKRLEDIHNFKQESDESLYQAWERYNDLLYKCPTHDINSHQKVNIFYKGLSTMNRQLLDSQGPIPGMTPTQALTAIQTMADHSQKWHDGTSSRNISSNSNTDGLAAIVSKLDNLGRDMKKLKENVHAIQVGCQICEGPHLDKECPLNEEVKQVEEVKYGEFRRPAPFNGSNGAKFRVGPPGYYTRTDNRPPYGEKRPSLEELMNKHQEESAQRSAKMEEWIKKLQENAKINTRNQSASLKNLETQIEQLTKELHYRTTNGAPSSSTGQCKVVNADHETPHRPISSSASVNVMPRNIFEYLRLANLRNANMLVKIADMTKKTPLGTVIVHVHILAKLRHAITLVGSVVSTPVIANHPNGAVTPE
ncbi:cysteine-rich receptor-like protein kinase [Tanacetum coccineum]|uniref:Cysteine-rich receptor-like protein kinase n=1 Tax=Tanacetum coccineum TaxID=301880 RepID=A0ABQ5FM93_9ASTR